MAPALQLAPQALAHQSVCLESFVHAVPLLRRLWGGPPRCERPAHLCHSVSLRTGLLYSGSLSLPKPLSCTPPCGSRGLALPSSWTPAALSTRRGRAWLSHCAQALHSLTWSRCQGELVNEGRWQLAEQGRAGLATLGARWGAEPKASGAFPSLMGLPCPNPPIPFPHGSEALPLSSLG